MCGFIAAVIAQVADAPLPAWGQLTLTGGMLTLLVWLITMGFPSMIKRYDEQLKESRDWHDKAAGEIRKDCEKERELFRNSTDKFNATIAEVMRSRGDR